MSRTYYVYTVSNKRNGTLYIGATNNLNSRMSEHKNFINRKSFASKYLLNKLVYYEECDNIDIAIEREKVLKNWRRCWKIHLINKHNPNGKDIVLK